MAISLKKLGANPQLHQVGRLLDKNENGRITKAELAEATKAVEAGTDNFTPAQRKALVELELIMRGDKPAPGPASEPTSRTSPLGVRLAGAASVDASGNLNRLNDTQRQVLADVKAKAKTRSDAARADLLALAERNGFSSADVDKALAYIANEAPVTINFHPDKALHQQTRAYGRDATDMKYEVAVDRLTSKLIDAFMVDGHYKNQFETGITSGSSSAYPGGSRDRWEKTIFEEGYHGHSLIPAERPKYGAMNAAKNPNGPASQYGTCFFELKPRIKERTTFTPKNSSGCQAANVGTAENFMHVLKDARNFKTIMNVALGRQERETGRAWSYLEAQVHGPVEFDKDIAAVVILKKYAGTEYETKIRKFAEKNGIEVKWTDGNQIYSDAEWASRSS